MERVRVACIKLSIGHTVRIRALLSQIHFNGKISYITISVQITNNSRNKDSLMINYHWCIVRPILLVDVEYSGTPL